MENGEWCALNAKQTNYLTGTQTWPHRHGKNHHKGKDKLVLAGDDGEHQATC